MTCERPGVRSGEEPWQYASAVGTMNSVTILDTTLRDGALSQGVTFTLSDKIAIASALASLGVNVIEVATAGKDPASHVAALSEHVRDAVLCVLAVASYEAIDAAGEALRRAASPRIHVYQAASAEPDAVARAEDAVRRARNLAADVEFSPANGARAPLEAVVAVTRAALVAGARTISFADTVGRALPEDVAQRLRDLHDRVPELGQACVSFHGHNDLGLATANTLAAVRLGARQVEVAVNGLGARAGNAALEEVVVALDMHATALGARMSVRLEGLPALSRLVEERSGLAVAAQKAIVGRNARWFRSEGS